MGKMNIFSLIFFHFNYNLKDDNKTVLIFLFRMNFLNDKNNVCNIFKIFWTYREISKIKWFNLKNLIHLILITFFIH